MLDIKVDENTIKMLVEKAISDRVDEIVKQKYFLTYKELSAYLNISKPIIEERLIKNGLPYYRVGSKYLFKKDEIDDFLDNITAMMTTNNRDLKFFNKLKESTVGDKNVFSC
jgi:excisionase family DNA binding protein